MSYRGCIDHKTINWARDFLCLDNVSETGKGVKVAIIDSGYSPGTQHLAHVDKKNTIDFTTSKSRTAITTSNSINDYNDRLDFYRDIQHWDHVNEDANSNSHGTEIASIIGGKNHENPEFEGVAPDCELYILKIARSENDENCNCLNIGNLLPVAITWAIANKIKLVNISIGIDLPTPQLAIAVREAYRHNVILICAAGNTEDPDAPGLTMEYPAALQKTISIGAYDSFIKPVMKTDKGMLLDFAAPGLNIQSYINPNYRNTVQYTSAATAFATGMIALLCEKLMNQYEHPIKYHAVKKALSKYTLEEIDTEDHMSWGYGIIYPKNF